MTFKVDRVPAVNEQIRALAQRAKVCRIRGAFLDALRSMLNHLENRPLEWGDPEYNTKLPGGLISHGIVWPLIVRFAVYESRSVVIIVDISPLPDTPFSHD